MSLLTDEEKRLLEEYMKGVKPLASNPHQKIEPKPQKKETYRPSPPIPPIIAPSPSYFWSDDYQDPVESETSLSYLSHSIPAKRFAELKNGLIPIQGSLDLHGMNTEQAREAVFVFLNKHKALQHRCVIIIHGKGRTQGLAPRLKNLVNHWLRQIPEVLAFHTALPKNGGTGAVYVLLKRLI